jgi:hypothetical protein
MARPRRIPEHLYTPPTCERNARYLAQERKTIEGLIAPWIPSSDGIEFDGISIEWSRLLREEGWLRYLYHKPWRGAPKWKVCRGFRNAVALLRGGII